MTTDAAENPQAKWGEWRAWSGGPCPIPWAKAGEYQLRFGADVEDGLHTALWWTEGSEDWWKHEGEADNHITAYRVRADLDHQGERA